MNRGGPSRSATFRRAPASGTTMLRSFEQDRAPDVPPHHPELAGEADSQLRGDRQPDCRDDHEDRSDHPFPTSTKPSTPPASRSPTTIQSRVPEIEHLIWVRFSVEPTPRGWGLLLLGDEGVDSFPGYSDSQGFRCQPKPGKLALPSHDKFALQRVNLPGAMRASGRPGSRSDGRVRRSRAGSGRAT